MLTKEQVIQKLDLIPLPEEGGFYRETYRSRNIAPARRQGIDVDGDRNLSTAIYYLVGGEEFSALHRLKGDEVFHFYGGDPVEMIQITDDGTIAKVILGSNLLDNEQVQVVVPAGTWQGTKLLNGGSWALLGTTMSPGFEFSDFELGPRDQLISKFPTLRADIERFTRP